MKKSLLALGLGMSIMAFGEVSPSPITSASIYKNGNVILTRHITPTDKVAKVKPIARPSYGTIWHNAGTPVTISHQGKASRYRISLHAAPELEEILEEAKKCSGMKVTLYRNGTTEKLYTVEGQYDNKTITLDSGSEILGSRNGFIASIKPLDDACECWVLEGASEEFDLQYLTAGILWAPSYRIELSEGKAQLSMTTEIRNEMANLDNVEVNLVSGFPSLKFAAVDSFLYPEATIESYTSQVGNLDSTRGRSARSNARYGVMSQAAIIYPESEMESSSFGSVQASAYRTGDAGAGNDIHYMPIGKLTLKKNESKMVPLGSSTTEYERFVEWSIKDRRDLYGQMPRGSSDDDKMELWDAIEFRNPFDFPMTTAAIEVVEDGRILGQAEAAWTNPDDKCTVKITPALSVKGLYAEEGSGKVKNVNRFDEEDEYLNFQGSRWFKEDVVAKLKVKNYRNEKAKVRIRKLLSGEIESSSVEPKSIHTIPARDYRPNVERELVWEIDLKPNAEKEIEIKYSLWVRG